MTLARRQALLARFLLDAAFEARVRADPEAVAAEHELPVAYVRRLAALDSARVAAFRKSRAHKDEVRAGKPPARLP